MTDTTKVRVFRWDNETLYFTALSVAIGIIDVAVGFDARWWVTVYAVALSASWFAAMRYAYWRGRHSELLQRQLERLRRD